MTPVVVVAGPPSAGVSGVAAALAARLPEADVREGRDTAGGRVRVAVLVVSAVAPMTESDCDVLGTAARGADAVVAVVTKIDAHRRWREVLAADRAVLAQRIEDVPWVGVAAAPPVGAPNLADLVAEVRRALDGGRPNVGAGRFAELRATRAALDRERRALAQPTARLRAGLHRERSGIGLAVRERCAGLRTHWRAAAAELPRRGMRAFERRVLADADAALAELDRMAVARVRALADELAVPAAGGGAGGAAPGWTAPPAGRTPSRRAERGLTLALGAGFGLGIAVAAGRVLQLAAPPVVATAVGAVAGLVLTVWLVATRELLHDRAAQDRWVCEVAGSLRAHADDLVARRLLDAELHLVAEVEKRRAERVVELSRRAGAVDAELRMLTPENTSRELGVSESFL